MFIKRVHEEGPGGTLYYRVNREVVSTDEFCGKGIFHKKFECFVLD